MKKLLAIIVLSWLFNWNVYSENIRNIEDFTIEGIKIGDSALTHFDQNLIKNNTRNYFKNKKFTPVEIDKHEKYKTFDSVSIYFLTNDNSLKIQGLRGVIDYESNFERCYKTMVSVSDSFSKDNKSFKKKKRTYNSSIAKLNDVKVTEFFFLHSNNDAITVSCYDYTEESGFQDHLGVTLRKKSFRDFLGVAYK